MQYFYICAGGYEVQRVNRISVIAAESWQDFADQNFGANKETGAFVPAESEPEWHIDDRFFEDYFTEMEPDAVIYRLDEQGIQNLKEKYQGSDKDSLDWNDSETILYVWKLVNNRDGSEWDVPGCGAGETFTGFGEEASEDED
jgi:hypothetical protein